MRNALVALLLATTGCAGTPPAVEAPTTRAANQTYAVHFERPSRVGDRSRLVTDHTSDMVTKISREGAVVSEKHDHRAVHYDAVSTVVAVDAKGRVTSVRYDVRELTSDGRRLEASVIQVTRHAKEKDADIVADGSPASEEVRKALSFLFKLGLAGATDEEVFGPKAPQPIGAHWRIDGALALGSFKEDGLDISSVTGDVWLDGTTRIDGAECLAVRVKLTIGGIQVPEAPPGSETEEGHAESEIRVALPVDQGGSVARAEEHQSMTMSVRVRVPARDGVVTLLSVESNESREGRETAL